MGWRHSETKSPPLLGVFGGCLLTVALSEFRLSVQPAKCRERQKRTQKGQERVEMVRFGF